MPTYNQWFSKLSKEERTILYIKRQERRKLEKEQWTPEQWKAYCNKPRNKAARWAFNLSIDERRKLEDHILEIRRTQWAAMKPEERIVEKVRHRTRRDNFTQEELDKERERGRQNVYNLKFEIVKHYTNGTMRCTNPGCEVPGGTKDIRALCIDHINGGGKKHAEELKKNGINFYAWLKKQKYPSGFQVLCQNCNIIKKVANKEDYRATAPFRRPYRRKAKDQLS